MFRSRTIAMVLALLSVNCASGGGADVSEGRVRALVVRWQDAWNAHDMDALAALFTQDADFVNVGAKRWIGRSEIRRQHAARLAQHLRRACGIATIPRFNSFVLM